MSKVKVDKNAVPNPWFDARLAWTSREAAARVRERMWQIVALLSCLVALVALGGLVYSANSTRFVPYVVEVDKLGAAMGVHPADRMKPVDTRVVRYSISNFISESRMVSPDVNVQKKAIFRVYAMLNKADVAFAKMNEYMNADPAKTPFARAATVTVETQIISVIPQTESSWEIDWMETIRERATGGVIESYRMRANVSYYIAPVGLEQTPEQLNLNPLSLFIRDYNWSKVQEAAK